MEPVLRRAVVIEDNEDTEAEDSSSLLRTGVVMPTYEEQSQEAEVSMIMDGTSTKEIRLEILRKWHRRRCFLPLPPPHSSRVPNSLPTAA